MQHLYESRRNKPAHGPRSLICKTSAPSESSTFTGSIGQTARGAKEHVEQNCAQEVARSFCGDAKWIQKRPQLTTSWKLCNVKTT
mmetsp:Transcript_8760/g.24481  ORF Transcript_8760/g.24481 Transcript_8760/m.24481 type:complete len:85 (+) Transcript_8760:380-634(+)